MEFNIRRQVKSVGGSIDGNFRFSIMWNDKDTRGIVDLDAHAIQPDGEEIFFRSYKKPRETSMTGQLDIDMIDPKGIGIENIYWVDLSKLMDGDYKFFVHNFNDNGNRGCKAEILFKGKLFQYYTPNCINEDEDWQIATLTIKDRRLVNIVNHSEPINIIENISDLPPMSQEELDNRQ